MIEHEHNWTPTRNIAQYRCGICGSFGYKPSFRTGGAKVGTAIIPYRCSKCGGCAITKIKRLWYCSEHRTNKENIND